MSDAEEVEKEKVKPASFGISKNLPMPVFVALIKRESEEREELLREKVGLKNWSDGL